MKRRPNSKIRSDAKTPAQRLATKRRWSARNIKKRRAYARAKYRRDKAADPAKILAACRRKRNLPAATRPAPHVCECCGQPPGVGAMNLDHDHVTGAFRGWLCRKCNSGIGLLGDTFVKVMRAATYLRRNS